jgi:putative 4-mercaptohistidine N1-methyltranferase
MSAPSATPYYETDRAIGEYLLFHYGTREETLPFGFGPAEALQFPVRCVTECLDAGRLPANSRALDLGCAVGRSTFELARHCHEVVGLDFSRRFIAAADHLRQHGSLEFSYADEGEWMSGATARVSPGIDRARVTFEQGDAMDLRAGLGTFDVVLMANLIDRLRDPRRCLERSAALLRPGGQLILTSPYTWLTEYTPRENWLGGLEREGRRVKTADTLREILAADFELAGCRDLPFLIREHARKFQWSVAEATMWTRR